MIKAINHITLAVLDIERSFNFYTNTLGFKPLAKWSQGAYLLVGDLWFCLSVDPSTKPNPDYTHYAFSVSQQNFAEMVERIQSSGVQQFKENRSEGDSFYFTDPDGHKLEIHVGDWQSRIQDAKNFPWGKQMQFYI